MRICFLAGANSIHSYRWVKYFADKGHEVHWISLVPSSVGYIKAVHYYEIKRSTIGMFSLLQAALQTKKLLTEINPEILHAHYAGTYGLVGALSGFHPYIVTAWGSDVLFAGKSKIKGPFIRFVLKRADLITCDAEHMRDAMIRLGVDSRKIRIIYFGTDTEKFNPGKRSESLRNELGLYLSPTVISLRNFEPVYDVQSLIQAIPLVLKEHPQVKFVIAGRGSEEERLKSLAKSIGVYESIRFVGFISSDELPQYLASADIYVSTSLSDAGLAASTAEAMSCGLPVIVTDSGENRIWVKDGENGFIIPVQDPTTLSEKIVYLLKHPDVRESFGAIGRKIIEEKNNYCIEMEKMDRIYREFIKTHG